MAVVFFKDCIQMNKTIKNLYYSYYLGCQQPEQILGSPKQFKKYKQRCKFER